MKSTASRVPRTTGFPASTVASRVMWSLQFIASVYQRFGLDQKTKDPGRLVGSGCSTTSDYSPVLWALGRGQQLRSAHLRLPTLRCSDDCHRDLRMCAAHPRTAGFTESTMSIHRSPRISSPSALHRMTLIRTPIVTAAYLLGSYMPPPANIRISPPGHEGQVSDNP